MLPNEINITKEIQQLNQKITQYKEEEQKIIAKQYNNDDIAYEKAMFDMIAASLWTGLSFDEIREILLKNLPLNSPRRKELINNEKSSDLMIRIKYPGAYDGFKQDVKSGLYGSDLSLPYDD